MVLIEGADVLLAPGEFTPSRILIDGPTIVEVGPGVRRPEDAQVVDLEGNYVVPGLIDLHTHLTNYATVDDERVDQVALTGTHRALQALRVGMTGARNVGSQHAVDISLRNAINAGRVYGPRMHCAGTFVVMTGGHSFQRGREADGPDEVRKATREQLKRGADLIKIMCSAGVSRPDESPDNVEFTFEEVRAAVEVAAAQGTYVAAHAHPAAAIIRAAKAGVRSIEHGSFLDEEAAAEMVARDMFLIPTFAIYSIIARSGSSLVEHAQWVESSKLESFRIASEAGVKWGVGSDSGVYAPVDAFIDELVYLHDKIGLSGEDVIARATRGNAALAGMTDAGVIAAGMRADLVAVRGNPLDGALATFRTARATVAGGRVFDWDAVPDLGWSATLGGLCGLIYGVIRQTRIKVWAAMVAAVLVSRPRKVPAPCRARPNLPGDLAGACLDPVAPPGDDFQQDGGHGRALVLGGRDQHRSTAGGQLRGECLTIEAFVRDQVTRGRPGAGLWRPGSR